MSLKRVIALDNFTSSDNLASYIKNSIISIVQEDPSGYYYYGLNESNKGGWFLKTAVADYVEPIKKVEAPVPEMSGGFMTAQQMEAYTLMQGKPEARKAAPIVQDTANSNQTVKKKAPVIPEVVEEPIKKKPAPLPDMNAGVSWSNMDAVNALMNQTKVSTDSPNTTLKKAAPVVPPQEKKAAPSPPTDQDVVKKKAAPMVPNPVASVVPEQVFEPRTRKASAPPPPEQAIASIQPKLNNIQESDARTRKAPPPPEAQILEKKLTKAPTQPILESETRGRKASAPPAPQVSWNNMDALSQMMPTNPVVLKNNDIDAIGRKTDYSLNGYAEPIKENYISNSSSTISSKPTTLNREQSPVNRKTSNSIVAATDERPRSDSSTVRGTRGRAASKGKQIASDIVIDSPSPLGKPLNASRSTDDLLGPSIKNPLSMYTESKSQKSPLDEYGARNFDSSDKGFIFQKVAIKKPMHKIQDTNARKQALSGFEYLLTYCGDANGNRFEAAREFIEISKNPLISDEMLCQLLKQSINNTSSVQESLTRVWALLCLSLVYCEPSLALKQALVDHLQIVSKYERPFNEFAIKALEILSLAESESKRKLMPSNVEIQSFESFRFSVPIKFDYPTGASKSYNITPFTKGSDILSRAAKYLTLPDYLDHGIIISIDDLEVLPMLAEDKALDVISIVEQIMADSFDKKTEASIETLSRAKFTIIRKVWMKVDPLLFNEMDEFELTSIYNEMRPNFINGDWLGQIQIQKEYLDQLCLLAATRSILEGKGDANYQYYLPKPILETFDNKKDKKSIINLSQLFANGLETARYSKPLQLRRDFIKTVHEWDLFGSRMFQVVFDSDNRLAGNALLAVRPDDIWFLDMTRKAITTLKYPEIQKIVLENGGREVIIKTGTVAQQRVVRFQSKQGFSIQTAYFLIYLA